MMMEIMEEETMEGGRGLENEECIGCDYVRIAPEDDDGGSALMMNDDGNNGGGDNGGREGIGK